MKINTSWLLVLGVASATALGVQASTMLSANAQTAGKTDGQVESPVRGFPANTGDASLCFTCGGDWPIFGGSFRAVDDNPTERGAGCGGDLIQRNDSRPFLCVN